MSGEAESTYLLFDTETTGIPRRRDAAVTDLSNWPRMVQIAWLICDQTGAIQREREAIIRPAGFVIPADATRIHGIDTAMAMEKGDDLKSVLNEFAAEIEGAAAVVSHNMSFDENIVGAEFIRVEVAHRLHKSRRICTMQAGTDICRIPGKFGHYKWPTLTELHRKLFGAPCQETHRALADVKICAKCFFELRRRGVPS